MRSLKTIGALLLMSIGLFFIDSTNNNTIIELANNFIGMMFFWAGTSFLDKLREEADKKD